MSPPDGGAKPPQTGLIDMGNISFYDEPGVLPPFEISDLDRYPGSFSEVVLNVTWAQLQPTQNGPLHTSAINSAISAVDAYNAKHGTDVGIKLRVWGGYTAPEWAKTIDGPAITVAGPGGVDPGNTQPETIGRFWTADYIDAWTEFQNQLAAIYDSNPIIRGITNTAGAWNTDEPFSQGPVSEISQLQAGGYTDAAEELTLRAGIADYSGWSTTPLDYSISLFRLEAADNSAPDPNFSLAVLQEAENSDRSVQAGNHALNSPLPSWANFVYAQIAADATLNPATIPASYQTDSPSMLGSQANWPAAIGQGAAMDAGNIELWDTPIWEGFTSKSPSWVSSLATQLANGVAPLTVAPDDGAVLEFIAPSLVSSAGGTIPFSGTNAVLLASASGAASYTVTVASADGNSLSVIENRQVLSGATVTFSGSLSEINTILASLCDSLTTGTDTLSITATDSDGNSATRTVGVAVSPGPAAPDLANQSILPASGSVAVYAWSGGGGDGLLSNPANWLPAGGPSSANDWAEFSANTGPATVAGSGTVGNLIIDSMVALEGGSDITVGEASTGDVDLADQPGSNGMLVLAGVESSLSIAGNLNVGGTDGSAGGSATLIAALAPSDYSTTNLSIGGTLNVWGEGTVRVTGALAATTIDIANGGLIAGDGTLSVARNEGITNDGTIEAVADRTLGLEQLALAAPLSGTGEIVIDAGAGLSLAGTVDAGQTIAFDAPTIEQLSNGPYSPTTLTLAAPSAFAGTITGFSFADQLVLEGVNATYADYSTGTLQVGLGSGGAPLTFALSGSLAGLEPLVTVAGTGSAAVSTISFAAPTGGVLPSVAAPGRLEATAGIAVTVPSIALVVPSSAAAANDTISVTITASAGALAVGSNHGGAAVSQTSPGSLNLAGTLDAVERSLQTLTYRSIAGASDRIGISVSDYAGTSSVATIDVSAGDSGATYEWSAADSGNFADASRWMTGGAVASSAPGGADIAAFGLGTYTVSGDGAVGEISDTGTLTLTGDVSAQGLPGAAVAVSVDSGGALTLAGGAVLSAGGTALVGASADGELTLMGGALALTGPSSTNALVIGEDKGSNGTVLDLEQITAAGTVLVGQAGSGTLQLLGVAASASDLSADIGQAAGASGAVVVDGGEWKTTGWLTVGDAGAGGVLIDGAANGITGQAMAADATIGHQAGSTGTVTLAGGDLLIASELASSSTLLVGGGGTGTLAVTNGGNVNVGVALTTTGNWQNTGTLIVGNSPNGSGLISIGDDASVEVDGNAGVGQNGGSGTVMVGTSLADTSLFAMTGTLSVGATGEVILGGPNALVRASAVAVGAGGTISGAGTISGDGGGNNTVMLASITNDGTVAARGGSLLIYGGVSGTGTLAADVGATLTLQASVGTGQTVQFAQDSVLVLNDAGAFHATIDGFLPGDTIDIGSLPAVPSGTAFLSANDVLTITEGSQTCYLRLDPSQNYSNDVFELSSDGSWGTAVTMVDPSGPPPPTVAESAATVSATIDQLNASAQSGDLGGIELTDPGVPTVSITALQLGSDQDALRFIHNPFDLAVSGSGFLGVTSTVQALNAGATTGMGRMSFVDGSMVYDTSDPAAQIFRLYQTVLDRPADAPGLSAWTGLLQAGVPLQQIAAAFLASPEYQAKFGATAQNPTSFVTQLYENGLHRAPDASGLAYWAGELASGQMTQAQVVVGISQSSESEADSASTVAGGIWLMNPGAASVAQLYYSALDRAPDLPGLTAWTGALSNGVENLQQVAAAFLDSSEFISKNGSLSNADFVTLMYHNALERAPDPGGYSYWLQELNSDAMSRAGVLLGFSESPEHLALTGAVTDHGIAFVG